MLTEKFVKQTFEKNGSYLSDEKDISDNKLCDETPKIIRDSILNNNDDVKNVLESLKDFEKGCYGNSNDSKY